MLKNPFGKQKELLKNQKIFTQSIQGLGDIMVFDTKKKRNESVENDLKKIKEIFDEFLLLQQNEPEKFEQLLLAEEYFEIQKKDEREASLRLAFSPDKYLIAYSTPINQIIRVHDAALEAKNEEISRVAIYFLTHILSDLSKTENNGLLVENLVGKIVSAFISALKEDDRSMYASGINWYTDIVFNNLGSDKTFSLDYLELFDKSFFSTTRYLISETKTKVFKALVDTFNDGTHLSFFYGADINNNLYSLISLIKTEQYGSVSKSNNLDVLVANLSRNALLINNKKKLDIWMEDYKVFLNIIKENIDTSKSENIVKLNKDVEKFVDSRLKYNHLIELAFAIGAYCLFKYFDQKNNIFLDYIKYLWEAHQPKDSDASWIGYDVVPNQIDELITLYFGDTSLDRKLDFWEGHHGSEIYYQKYFLLLLLRALQPITADGDGKYLTIENYKLPKLQIYRLSDLKYIVDQLIPLVTSLKEDKQILIHLGIKEDQVEEFLDNKLLPLLKRLKIQADEQIEDISRTQNIDKNKVIEFRKDVVEGYNKSYTLKNIFKFYNKYKDESQTPYTGSLPGLVISQIFDKEAFFKEWYVHYGDFGKDYGRNMSAGEDKSLAEELFKQAINLENGVSLEDVLSKFKQVENILVIATNRMVYEYFQSLPSFVPKWRNDLPTTKAQEIRGFEGVYKFGEIFIPIFTLPNLGWDKKLLVINYESLGNMTQLSPLKDESEKAFQEENLYVSVQEYGTNPDLLNALIEKAPDWLTKHGVREEQEKYLQEKVVITIIERYEYKASENPELYSLKIE